MFQIFADGKLIYQPGNEILRLISPKLTVEIGKAGSLEFSVPPTNKYYDNLQQLRTLLTVEEDGEELFRGRVLSNKRNFTNVRDVYGEGNLSFLVDSCQKGKKYTGSSRTLFENIIAEHNRMIQNPEKQFAVGVITVEDHDVVLRGQSDDITNYETNKFDYKQIALNSIAKEWLNTFEYIETCLLDYCGGYLRTRYVATENKTYIDWLKDYYDTSTQTIQLGKNLLDLTEEVTAEELFTVLIPLGDENLTIKKVNNGSIELVDEEAVAKYGRIIKTNVFDGVTKASTLLENGKRYLKSHVEVPVTITVNAVDLHLLNPAIRAIHVGDKVHVVSPANNVDRDDLVCTKIEYDLTNPANTVYTFGNPKQTLTERYRKNKKDEAGRGGGGGAAAAEQVSQDQIDFYKAWVNVKNDEGIIDLGTLFTRVKQLGGDPDNPADQEIVSKTKIYMSSDDGGSKIDLISSFDDRIANISNQAGVNIESGPNGSELILYVNNGDYSANINLGMAYNITEDDYGHFTYTPRSNIALVADVVEVEGLLKATNLTVSGLLKGVDATFESLESGTLNIKKHIKTAGAVIDSLVVSTTNGASYVEFGSHHHKLSCDALGTVTLGDVVVGGNGNSFNMADTAFFKGRMSAVKVKTLKADFTGTYKQHCKVYVQALNENGVEVEEGTKNKEFTNPYQPSFLEWSRTENKDTYTITVKPVNLSGTYITAPNGSNFPSKTYTNNAYKNVTVNSITGVSHTAAGASFDVNLSNGKSVRKSIFW